MRGLTGGAGAQPVAGPQRRRPARLGDRERGAAGRGAARPHAADPGTRAHQQRPGAGRASAGGPDRGLQHDHGGHGVQGARADGDGPAARPDGRERAARLRQHRAGTAAHARVRARAHPGRGGAAGHDRRRAPLARPDRAAPRRCGARRPAATSSPRPAATLPRLAQATREFLPRIDEFNRCVTEVILPDRQRRVDDGPLSAGVENYKEFWHAMVGQAGEGQGFDGNGPLPSPGDAEAARDTIQTGRTNYGNETLFANVCRRRCARGRPSPARCRRCGATCRATATRSRTSTDRRRWGPPTGRVRMRPRPAVPPLGSASAAALVPVRELDLETGR